MDSKKVLEIFKEITTVPRESGHEEKIIKWLMDFAKKNKLQAKKDKVGDYKAEDVFFVVQAELDYNESLDN